MRQEIIRELDELKKMVHQARIDVINERYINARVVVAFDMQEKVDELFEMLHEAIEKKGRGKHESDTSRNQDG